MIIGLVTLANEFAMFPLNNKMIFAYLLNHSFNVESSLPFGSTLYWLLVSLVIS